MSYKSLLPDLKYFKTCFCFELNTVFNVSIVCNVFLLFQTESSTKLCTQLLFSSLPISHYSKGKV